MSGDIFFNILSHFSYLKFWFSNNTYKYLEMPPSASVNDPSINRILFKFKTDEKLQHKFCPSYIKRAFIEILVQLNSNSLIYKSGCEIWNPICNTRRGEASCIQIIYATSFLLCKIFRVALKAYYRSINHRHGRESNRYRLKYNICGNMEAVNVINVLQ